MSLTLRLPPETDSVTRLLDALEGFAEEHDIPMAAMARLNILADDLAANVVIHAKGATHLEASLHHTPGQLTFILADDGAPFDPLAQAAPDTTAPVGERVVGGLGIHLLRQMASSVEYRYESGRNILTLTLADSAK
jgi:serine/threonine-protein kinase RsbW